MRNYLTMQMSMRRFTRLTNAFSKKLENYAAQVALHFWYYSFCRTHATLKTTPAVAGRRYLLPVYDLTSEAVENVFPSRGYSPTPATILLSTTRDNGTQVETHEDDVRAELTAGTMRGSSTACSPLPGHAA